MMIANVVTYENIDATIEDVKELIDYVDILAERLGT